MPKRSTAPVTDPIPVSAPEPPHPPTFRDLTASAAAMGEAQARARRAAFFAASRPIAVQGIPRWEAFGDEARAQLDLANAEGVGSAELARLGICPYLEVLDEKLRGIRAVLENPKLARRTLDEIDHMSLAEMTVSHVERAVGLDVPRRWYVLRERLHCVGAGDDRIQIQLRGLPEILGKIRGWYRQKLVEQGLLPAAQE